jgi:hypothetical protein
MEHFLISIIPSEDIAIRIRKLRTLIFKKFGLVSARCLPELLPVAFIKEIISKEKFQELIQPSELTSKNFISTDTNDIFLQITNSDFINNIRKIITSYSLEEIITLESGVYMGSAEKISDIKEIISFLHGEEENFLTWKKNSLELIRIETFNEIWWENVRWETIWNQKIKLL